jgi:hypothetical protein
MSTRIRLLAVDVDGTLVSRGVLDDADAEALRAAAQAGIAVCLCTGRSWAEVRPVWQELRLPGPHAPAVCVGGALVAEPDTGQSLYSRSFDRPVAADLARHLRGLGYPVMALVDAWREGFDYYLVGRFEGRPLYRRFFDGRGWRVRHVEALEAPSAPARALRVSVLEEPARAAEVVADVRRRFAGRVEAQAIYAPNYDLHIVEAFAAGANKFTALVYVGQGLRVGAGAMAAVGDDHNDLAMLRGVGLSAAPADAPLEVRQAASLTLAPRGRNPVAQFVRAVLRE